MFSIKCNVDGAHFCVNSLQSLEMLLKKIKMNNMPIISMDTSPIIWNVVNKDEEFSIM